MSKVRDIGGVLDALAWSALPWPSLIRRAAALARQKTLTEGEVDYATGRISLTLTPFRFRALNEIAQKLAFSGEPPPC